LTELDRELGRRRWVTKIQRMGTDSDAADRPSPVAGLADTDQERLAALNRQIRIDMRPAARKPRYGWLLVAVLPVIVALLAFAALRVGGHASGGPSVSASHLTQAYEQTKRVLQQTENAAQQQPGVAAGPLVSP
jgi:hypothetical protein